MEHLRIWHMCARMRGDSAEALLRRYTAPEEVMEMPGHCGACGAPCLTRMFQTEIPFFKARPPPPSAARHRSHICLAF